MVLEVQTPVARVSVRNWRTSGAAMRRPNTGIATAAPLRVGKAPYKKRKEKGKMWEEKRDKGYGLGDGA